MQDLEKQIRNLFVPLTEGLNKKLENNPEKERLERQIRDEFIPLIEGINKKLGSPFSQGVQDYINERTDNPLNGKEI